MSRTGIPNVDRADPKGAHVAHRLETSRVAWLTTVAADGTPQTSPVWFLWDGESFLVYSLDSPRARNVQAHPRVSLNLDGNGLGGDIIVVEGTATIAEDSPPAAQNPAYLAKYGPVMAERGWSPEWFSKRYRIPIRITATRYRYW